MLQERACSKGDRVALVMRNLPEWPVVFMGALAGGRHRGAAERLVDAAPNWPMACWIAARVLSSPMPSGWRG